MKITLTSGVFTELTNTMKYRERGGGSYITLFLPSRHSVDVTVLHRIVIPRGQPFNRRVGVGVGGGVGGFEVEYFKNKITDRLFMK